jgi:FMN phosphatase YigB (HAD superfamily)
MPASAFFQTVLAESNLSAVETVFISSQGTHLAGADRAGMATIAFNHRSVVHADLCLDRFADVLEVVRNGQARSRAA